MTLYFTLLKKIKIQLIAYYWWRVYRYYILIVGDDEANSTSHSVTHYFSHSASTCDSTNVQGVQIRRNLGIYLSYRFQRKKKDRIDKDRDIVSASVRRRLSMSPKRGQVTQSSKCCPQFTNFSRRMFHCVDTGKLEFRQYPRVLLLDAHFVTPKLLDALPYILLCFQVWLCLELFLRTT